MILWVHRWLYHVVSTCIVTRPYDVMRSSIFLRMSDNPLYGVFSYINLAIIEVISVGYGFTQMVLLRFDPPLCCLFVVFVIHVIIFGIARFLRIDVSVCRGRKVCVCGYLQCHTARSP